MTKAETQRVTAFLRFLPDSRVCFSAQAGGRLRQKSIGCYNRSSSPSDSARMHRMSDSDHIDPLLNDWPYDPETVNVRTVKGDDGRDVVQMRIDLGVLQLEFNGRPDGERPFGSETYLAYLIGESGSLDGEFKLDEEQCEEVDREFIQFYHRRICWLKMQRYDLAVRDADHTLALMDFCTEHGPDEQWSLSHEQYRPFVLFHRTQAAGLHAVEEGEPEGAISQLNEGLEQLRDLFLDNELEEYYEENELVVRLTEFRESLRDQFDVGQTLQERLAEAVATEQYELAAELRDRITKQDQTGH